MKKYSVIGLMSGTSLDGLDMIHCDFLLDEENNHWLFEIHQSMCIPFTEEWQHKLKTEVFNSPYDLCRIDAEFGEYMAEKVNQFIEEFNIEADFIASHGYTVYHEPKKKFTTQIGNGATMSSLTALPVICDFRTCDVALNGLGAPIVPFGDVHLFEDYSFCINIGGIANISCRLPDESVVGSDICPANLLLNEQAQLLGKDYDENGDLGRQGNVNNSLLDDLNKIDYFKKPFPKTLEALWVEEVYGDILHKHDLTVKDKLRTLYEHIGKQIGNTINELNVQGISNSGNNKVLISGGGAYNKFLIECIDKYSPIQLEIPRDEIIEFKEALIIGFLGVLRARNTQNCLSTVTGADVNSIGGAVYRGTSTFFLK